jgi:translation initiation factor IF-2
LTDNKEEKSKGRAKLTLKLSKPSEGVATVLPKKEGVSRFSGSNVQVTIKGRKKRDTLGLSTKVKSGISSTDMESRQRLISEAEDGKESVFNHSNILNKLGQAASEAKEKEMKRNQEKRYKEEEEKNRLREIERKKEEKEKIKKSQLVDEVYKDGSIDVLGKIKSSLKDQEKDYSKKKVDEVKKSESKSKDFDVDKKPGGKSEELGKVVVDLSHYKNSVSNYYNDDEEEIKKPAKNDYKKDKSHKRGIHTFIVNSEGVASEDKYDFRRVNKGIRSKSKSAKNNKDYEKVYQDVEIPEFITVGDLAERMNEKKTDVIKKLISMGTMATINQTIDSDTAELLVTEFGHKFKKVSDSDVESILNIKSDEADLVERMPVVTIMGHVDHGKTSLLDAIRSTNVVSGESGGITQHIGASKISLRDGKFITFLDTPGHEAFTEMRLRGAHVTDLVVLVVAADDGVKEQTIEAINHARAAKVPMIVAINKIDKPGADPSRVKNELLNQNIVSEDLGGDIMFVEVSAKEKKNLDKLQEAILLQSEMLELKASRKVRAKGAVIESKIDASRGVIATFLVQEGVLKVGDLVVAGTAYGKIKKMIDSVRKSQKEAIPSMAVEVMGLDKAPKSGEEFFVIQEERKAREIISYREKKKKDAEAVRRKGKSLSEMLQVVGGGKKELPLIIKADVQGSVEAIISSLEKLNTDEVGVRVIHAVTGGISESDVNLASVSNALIIGFNVRANNQTRELAKNKGVDIRYNSIIYNVIDEIKAILSGMLNPIKREERLGQAEIRQVFKITGSGKVAGCFVTDGMMQRNARVRLLRDNVVIYDGKLKALKRFKDDVKEVKQGFECGLSIEGYEDIKEGDFLECYNIIQEKREL